jgi:hypothetical protein
VEAGDAVCDTDGDVCVTLAVVAGDAGYGQVGGVVGAASRAGDDVLDVVLAAIEGASAEVALRPISCDEVADPAVVASTEGEPWFGWCPASEVTVDPKLGELECLAAAVSTAKGCH